MTAYSNFGDGLLAWGEDESVVTSYLELAEDQIHSRGLIVPVVTKEGREGKQDNHQQIISFISFVADNS